MPDELQGDDSRQPVSWLAMVVGAGLALGLIFALSIGIGLAIVWVILRLFPQ